MGTKLYDVHQGTSENLVLRQFQVFEHEYTPLFAFLLIIILIHTNLHTD
jgi:hypothetical protein